MSTPKTPTKPSRPKFQRSRSAAADFSPPQRTHIESRPTTAQYAAKRLHLPGNHKHDYNRKHNEKHRVDTTLHKLSPVTTSGNESGSKSRDDLPPSSITQALSDEASGAIIKSVPPANARPEDVVKEMHRRRRRDEELRSTLNGLSELAHDSTRQLDNMFYSIVEKVSTLQATMRSLQQLSVRSTRLHDEFRKEATTVEADYRRQVDHFSEFEDQQKQIGMLEQRIHQGVTKTQMLSNRLEAARKRVELWEKRENEWQARTSMRLRIGWTCGGVLLIIILALVVVNGYYRAPFRSKGPPDIANARTFDEAVFREMQEAFNAHVEAPRIPRKPQKQPTLDSRLIALDNI